MAVDVNDPLADKLNNISDVHVHFPGLLEATKEWFRLYKVPDGNPPNEIALNGEFRDRR